MSPVFSSRSSVGAGGAGGFTFGKRRAPIVPSFLGCFCDGGYLICQSGGVRWIVAPASSQVVRSWYSRNNANTTAQQVSGCTGWFVPTIGQLQNPGYACRNFWDSYSCSGYWSSTDYAYANARALNFATGGLIFAPSNEKPNYFNVRSFRCVTY